MRLLEKFGSNKVLNFCLALSTLAAIASLVESFVLNSAQNELMQRQVEAVNETKMVNEALRQIGEANLAAMDAIVDASSGTIDPELTKIVDEFKQFWSQSQPQIQTMFEHQGQTKEAGEVTAAIDGLLAGIDQLWTAVPKRALTDSLSAKLDDAIDGDAGIAGTLFGALRQTYEQRLKEVQDEMSASGQENLMIQVVLCMLVIFFQLALSAPVNFMAGKRLNQSLNEIRDSVDSVRNTSQELSKYGGELAAASVEQNASVTQTVAAMTEIQSVIRRNSESLAASRQQSHDANTRASEGSAKVQSLAESMRQISESRSDLAKIVNSIEEIRAKTNQINNIVFKTQILSFNASIEAAKAGAHGKGFAVVATEVGRLADMSGSAATQIESIIRSSLNLVTSTVQSITDKITEASKSTEDAKLSFDAISQDVQKVFESIDDMSVGVNEQSAGVDQCVAGMQQLSVVATKNSEVATKITSNVETLERQSGMMETRATGAVALVNGQNASQVTKVAGETSKQYSQSKAQVLTESALIVPMPKASDSVASDDARLVGRLVQKSKRAQASPSGNKKDRKSA
jgi:methyl-accepting chemotaxis protein